jgi:ribosomal protein S18 acetylase RimI-like enzyme
VSAITDIEEAFAAHWSLFGRWPKGQLHDEQGVLWFETPIAHLPYNGVIRTNIEDDADAPIADTIARFQRRGVHFFWLAHPSAQPPDLSDRLTAAGVPVVETATGMSLELDGWEAPAPPEGVTYREVLDEDDLLAYHRLTAAYWELPDADAAAVEELQRALGPGLVPGHRYLALVDGSPVGKGYVSLAGPPGVGALFAMSVLPAARGRGIAGGLTALLVERAKGAGCRRVVLHSSDMAQGVYLRAGFVEQCRLPFHATTAVWSHER